MHASAGSRARSSSVSSSCACAKRACAKRGMLGVAAISVSLPVRRSRHQPV